MNCPVIAAFLGHGIRMKTKKSKSNCCYLPNHTILAKGTVDIYKIRMITFFNQTAWCEISCC